LAFSPLVVGIGLACYVYMGFYISKAHYNPIVSLAATLNGGIDITGALLFIFSQMLGSFIAALVAVGFLGYSTLPFPKKGVLEGVFAESIFSFLLINVILNLTARGNKKNWMYGFCFGVAVMMGAFCVGDISGAMFNPAGKKI
jgi:aquaporin Z